MFTGPIDGRARRAADSRGRIVAAMLALVGEGIISPTAEDVAARAEVGLRTVFRHFKDMESLYAEMMLELGKRFEAMAEPFESVDWRGQLRELTERRLGTYERLMPFKRAADAHRHESAALQANHAGRLALMRARLRGLLPAELAADAALFEALDLALSFDAWQRLRGEQGLTNAQARGIVEGLLRALLGSKP
jgi:AcrR family transcriptional regulator